MNAGTEGLPPTMTASETCHEDIAVMVQQTLAHLNAIEPDLMAMERDVAATPVDALDRMQRALDTIRSAAGLFGLDPLQHLAAGLASAFAEIREGRLTIATPVVDVLITSIDHLRVLLDTLPSFDRDEIGVVLGSLNTLIKPVPSTTEDRPQSIEAKAEKAGTSETLRIRVDLLTDLMNLAGELVLGRNQLMRALAGEARESGLGLILQNINQVTTALQEGIMQTRMQPAETVFHRFPRIIRDVSRQLGKRIELEILGSEVELDRSLVELLTDPLTHILRNSADHAIEMPEERRRAGKPITGRIVLKACHQDGQVNISIQDDGRGIDSAKVRRKALDRGLISESQAEQMTERELVSLIFTPGFSTMDAVSELSGRGVGMDVVRSNTERMGGTVEVDTVLGRGTTLTMRLPLTLAIIPSMIVGVGGQRFAIPQVHVVEFVSVQACDVAERLERIKNSAVLRLRDRLLPLIRLGDVLRLGTERREGDYDIVVLQIGTNQFGVVVDELFDIEEIVVKPVSACAQSARCFSGATIIGDGRVIMILDVSGLVALAGMQFADTKAENERRFALERQRTAATASRLLSVLLCTGAPDEYLAIPQDSILRLEMFAVSAIQRIGHQEYVNYRGHGLPLVRLEKHIRVRPLASDLAEIFVIIPKLMVDGRVVAGQAGIVISSILDALDADVVLERIDPGGPGVMGSAIVNDRLTLFLEPGEILAAAGHRTGGPQ